MALTNPNKLINVQELSYFEGKVAAKYQTQAITAITGLSAETVEGALAELLGKITAIPSAIIPKGTRTFSQLAPSTDLVAGSLGFMWNISDAFTTTSDFAEGSGKSVAAGSNVYVANVGTAAEPSYKYDIFAGPIDLSGYALKSEMSVEAGTGANADKTTITLKTGTSATVLTTHQDISGKADKLGETFSATEAYAKDDIVIYSGRIYKAKAAREAGAWDAEDFEEITDNFLSLGADGNIKDSGKKTADFATAAQGSKADSAVQSVAEGDTNGTVAVDGTDVAVHGLGSAAYAATSDFQANVGIAADSDIDEIFA